MKKLGLALLVVTLFTGCWNYPVEVQKLQDKYPNALMWHDNRNETVVYLREANGAVHYCEFHPYGGWSDQTIWPAIK